MSIEQTTDSAAFAKARQLVRRCATDKGFLASPTAHDNYRRIWGRDGVIVGLAVLMGAEGDLVDVFARTLETLAAHQGPYGEMPSNVGLDDEDVSYGGTAGRVDANLWFVIGVAEYCRSTDDERFAGKMIPVLDRVMFLLGAWEFNNRGFLYVPATGDWADEYIHSGYVLYDQLLYLQALRSYRWLISRYARRPVQEVADKIRTLTAMIRTNFWIRAEERNPDHLYHEILFEKGRAAADHCAMRYWLPFFSPNGYGYRFDGFANILASLLDVADDTQRESVDRYLIEHVVPEEIRLLPAFHPVIERDDRDWEELKVSFSEDFKNKPYEFHNGGLWPMLAGFYAADLARRGRHDEAGAYRAGIGAANRKEMDGTAWSFPEYVNGRDFTAGGNKEQCWSGSAYLMACYGLQGKSPFSINDYDSAVQ